MERKHVVAATVGQLPYSLKPKDCPLAILKLVSNRLHAYEAYKSNIDCANKILLIEKLKSECRQMLNEHPCTVVKWMIKVENQIISLSPTQNSKLKENYQEKVKALMAVAHDFLAKKIVHD